MQPTAEPVTGQAVEPGEKPGQGSETLKAGYADLDATAQSLRFFESGYKQPPRRDRVYKTRFYAGQARYLNWQLDLKYAKPGRRVDFTIHAVCYRPNGEVKFEQDMKAHAKPEWTSSWHSRGWGNRTPGEAWDPGRYRLELSVEGRKVAQGYFTVLQGKAPPEEKSADWMAQPEKEGYTALGATVSSLRFYESGRKVLPKSERVYRTSFRSPKVRFIFWQVDLKYPSPGRRVDFTITATCYKPDGVVQFSQFVKSYAKPDWTSSWITKGWGNDTPGRSWPPGRYRLALEVNGEKIAENFFTVTGE